MEYSYETNLSIGVSKEFICNDYRQWDEYYEQTKSLATQHNLWRYMVPSIQHQIHEFQGDRMNVDQVQPEPEEPQLPLCPPPPHIDASREELQHYENLKFASLFEIQIYRDASAKFRDFERRKLSFKAYLDRTTPLSLRIKLNMQPYLLLAWWTFLQANLRPSDEIQLSLLEDERIALCKGPKSNRLEDWFQRWQRYEDRAVRWNQKQAIMVKNDFVRSYKEHVDTITGRFAGEKNSLFEAIEQCRKALNRRPGNLKLTTYATFVNHENSSQNHPQNLRTPRIQQMPGQNNTRMRGSGCAIFTKATGRDVCPNLGVCPIVNWKLRPKEADMTPAQLRKLKNYVYKLQSEPEFLEGQLKYRDPMVLDISRKMSGGDGHQRHCPLLFQRTTVLIQHFAFQNV